MYNFDAFVEDKEYLTKNMLERHDIKMKNMPRRASNKSKAGAYTLSNKYHFLKPMMSRHGDMIRLVMKLLPWDKSIDQRVNDAISTIAYCHASSYQSSRFLNPNSLGDLGWALKDLHNVRTPWEKFTVKRAFASTTFETKYTDRRQVLSMIPQSIRTIAPWNSSQVFTHETTGSAIKKDPNLAIKSHPINSEFVQAYKYRTLEDRRLTWFHSGLAAEYVKSHVCDLSKGKVVSTLNDRELVLFKKMSLVNDVKILGGWVKAMKDLHPASIGSGLPDAVKTFISDGYRMGLPGYYQQDPRLTTINYENMSVLEMINGSVNNHRIQAEQNRLALEKYQAIETDSEMVKLALPESLEALRIKTSNEMRLAGAECGHCIGSYSQDTHHMFFRKGNVCAMVSMTSGNIIQCFDRNNKNTPASKKFQSYLMAEIKKADIPFLRTIKKKTIPAEYFNNEVRYDYPF